MAHVDGLAKSVGLAYYGALVSSGELRNMMKGPVPTIDTVRGNLEAEVNRRQILKKDIENPESPLTAEQRNAISGLLRQSDMIIAKCDKELEYVVLHDRRGGESGPEFLQRIHTVGNFHSLKRSYMNVGDIIQTVRALNQSMETIKGNTQASMGPRFEAPPPAYEVWNPGTYRVLENGQTDGTTISNDRVNDRGGPLSLAPAVTGNAVAATTIPALANDRPPNATSTIPDTNAVDGSPEPGLPEISGTVRNANIALRAVTDGLPRHAQEALAGTVAGAAGLTALTAPATSFWTYRSMRAAERTLELVQQRQETELEKLRIERDKAQLELTKLRREEEARPQARFDRNQAGPGDGGDELLNGQEANGPSREATNLDLQIKNLTISKLSLEIAALQAQTGALATPANGDEAVVVDAAGDNRNVAVVVAEGIGPIMANAGNAEPGHAPAAHDAPALEGAQHAGMPGTFPLTPYNNFPEAAGTPLPVTTPPSVAHEAVDHGAAANDDPILFEHDDEGNDSDNESRYYDALEDQDDLERLGDLEHDNLENVQGPDYHLEFAPRMAGLPLEGDIPSPGGSSLFGVEDQQNFAMQALGFARHDHV